MFFLSFDDEMPVILANSLRVYLASVFCFCLFGGFTNSSIQFWFILKTLSIIRALLCPSGNCPIQNYFIATYVHNFIIN